MNAFRKIIGLIILIFLGLPLLFGIIWAVGLTKTAVSPEFVTQLPQEIIAEIPSILDEIFVDAQDEDVIADPNTRAWFEAASKMDVSPRELLARIGLLDWLDHELSDLLEDVEEILRGERRARTLIFDLRPLKEALMHPEFFRYLEGVVLSLPPCENYEERDWERSTWRDWDWFSLPACRPDPETFAAILEEHREDVLYEIPDDVEIFEDIGYFPFGISRVVTWLSYSLFLLPAIVIFLAALIAASSPASFFRWSGIPILLGGLGPLLLSLLSRQVARWAIFFKPYSHAWSSDLQNLIADKTEWIQLAVVDHLFSPVIAVAGVVCVLGVLLIALSLIVSNQKPVRYKTRTVQPTPPAAAPAEPEPEEEIPSESEPPKKEEEKENESA